MADRDAALLSLELPDRSTAAAAARKALTALNGSLHLISSTRLADAQLLASELVANAVRHGGRAGTPVTVSVRASPGVMRLEVSDHGDGFDPDRLSAPSGDQAGGWGLAIVAALADRWGVAREPRTTVWFEIDRPQSGAPLSADPVAAEQSTPPPQPTRGRRARS